MGTAFAASPCDDALYPNQCGYFGSGSLPPYVHDAITAKGGTIGTGSVLVLTSGNPAETSDTISNDMNHNGCGTNPDGWQTYDCNTLNNYVPPQDSVVLALSSEWFEWYQTIFTDWMIISGAGVPPVDVSINSWINNKVDILPYGPMDTGVVILTSLSQSKMINLKVADSGDHIYDTAIVIVPSTWFGIVASTNQNNTILCGNGNLEPGEDCDDGNTIPDDDCNSLCLGNQTPGAPQASQTCGNLVYSWPSGTTSPYTCGADLCMGYRCVQGNTISPACYTAEQCAAACVGSCVDVQTAQMDCANMCSIQPPLTSPSTPPATCSNLTYVWPDGTTMPYSCNDTCAGQRCVKGTVISPECYAAGNCIDACTGGTCVDLPAPDCSSICALGDEAATQQSGDPCNTAGETRLSANQKGACFGNQEICDGATMTWQPNGDFFINPEDELCNGIDDNCNGIVDDMFETCGDPGLCQNTVNTCDPNNPTVPVVCTPLPAPSPVEICNDGLDNDCDGSADDGCECGDNECMPGENFIICPADCPFVPNTPCEDGDFCTIGDVYDLNGACQGGQTITCEDNNLCTTNETCDPNSGCSATKLDCDDADPCTIDSCDSATGCIHDPNPSSACTDADQDGYAADLDCDDNNPNINPGATELCNGIDDDCDSAVDEGYNVGAACQSSPNSCGDVNYGNNACDADGLGTHCDAITPAERPNWNQACTSAPNSCGDTNQGMTDCNGICMAQAPADPPGYGDSCTSQQNACGETSQGTIQCDGTCSAVPPIAADSDNDGTPDCLDQCPYDSSKTSPGLCGCGLPDSLNTYYRDADSDGYGDALDSTQACTMPSGYVTDYSDCDDSKASVNPGAPEICDNIDNNCNGLIDENVDIDKDGVDDCSQDLCSGTKADSQYIPRVPLLWLNKNRWVLEDSGGIFKWTSTKIDKNFKPTISYTDGCSCKQILDNLSKMGHEKLFKQHPENLMAQYLFGCTKVTLEDWHEQN